MTVIVTYNRNLVGGDAFGEFQTNTFETHSQLSPDVLSLSDGGFVCAYNNFSDTAGFVILDFYNDALNSTGYQTAYASVTTMAVGQPKLTELANGNVLVVWDDDDATGSNANIRAAIFGQDGTPVAQDIDLAASESSINFGEADVAALNAGGFVVSYSFGGEIYFRRYDNAGVQQGGQVQANTTVTGVQADTQVTVLNNGAFALTWTDTNPADQQVRTRIFESNGAARTAELTVSLAGADNTQSSVVATRDGGYAVAFTDTGWPGDPQGISLRLVGANGAMGALIHVNDSTTNDESDPDVTILANGYIAVSWTYAFTGTDHDVRCRIFDQSGLAVTEVFDIASGGSEELRSAISGMAEGLFATSWQDSTADSDGGSIESQITELTRVVVGDNAADSYIGDELRDNMDGGGGNDTLLGMGGDDFLHGDAFDDSIDGGAGSDTVQGGFNEDTLHGGDGNDFIYAATQASPIASSVADLMFGDAGTDRIRGANGADTMDGGTGDDKLTSGVENDLLMGGDGFDKLKGQSEDDTLEGGENFDTLNGGVGNDVLYAMTAANIDGSVFGDGLNGAAGADTLYGSNGLDNLVGLAGKDILYGRGGGDTLSGGTEKDILTGGADSDMLTGGSDKDTFVYLALTDSANGGGEDLITDLGNHDFIDLSAIDAKTGNPGDQAFTLVAAFTHHRGELIVDFNATGPYAGLTSIQGDVNGDGAADFTILAAGDQHNFASFVL